MSGITMMETTEKSVYPVHATHMGMPSLRNTSFRRRSSRGGFWLSAAAVVKEKEKIHKVIEK
jgi:hypothetical protein